MTTWPEDDYRDYLKGHLDLIEPGLTLVDTEFFLPNTDGARGFVDLLARDKSGKIVVIELKREETAARQALHELFKYVALLAQNHGLGTHQLRCILLSTTWHELLIPFSDFLGSVPFNTIGLRLLTDNSGDPTSIERIDPLPPSKGRALCPKHHSFLYVDRAIRDAAVQPICDHLETLGVVDYIVFTQDYRGSSPDVFEKYCTYIAINELSETQAQSLITALALPEDEVEVGEFYVEESVFADLYSIANCHGVEISYPDKYIATTKTWPTGDIRRGGLYASEVIWSRDAIDAILRAVGGRFTSHFYLQASSRGRDEWARGLANMDYPLLGLDEWRSIVPAVLEEYKESLGEISISVAIFSPGDLIQSLGGLGAGTPDYLPQLEVEVVATSGETAQLMGTLLWDGKTIPESVSDIADATFVDTSYLFAKWAHDVWRHDAQLAAAHGLRYVVLERRNGGDLERVGADLQRTSFESANLGEHILFGSYLSAAAAYLKSVADFVRSGVAGADPFFPGR